MIAQELSQQNAKVDEYDQTMHLFIYINTFEEKNRILKKLNPKTNKFGRRSISSGFEYKAIQIPKAVQELRATKLNHAQENTTAKSQLKQIYRVVQAKTKHQLHKKSKSQRSLISSNGLKKGQKQLKGPRFLKIKRRFKRNLKQFQNAKCSEFIFQNSFPYQIHSEKYFTQMLKVLEISKINIQKQNWYYLKL